MSRNTYIYVLVCPISHRIRYVGSSYNPSQRVKIHVKKPMPGTAGWISILSSEGRSPILVVVETVADKDQAMVIEKDWIQRMAKVHPDLLNITHNPNKS